MDPTTAQTASGEPTETPVGARPTASSHTPGAGDRLYRCRDGRMLAGVAGGVAEYFDVDPVVVRIGLLVLALVGGLAVPVYLAGWLLIPEEGSDQSVAEELLARQRLP